MALHFHPLGDAIRWAARTWSIATIALVLGFIVGEGVNLSGTTQLIGFFLFPVGICAGMIVSWRKAILGGAITVGCLLGFYLLTFVTVHSFPKGWAYIAFAFPGFLFLFSSCHLHWHKPLTVHRP